MKTKSNNIIITLAIVLFFIACDSKRIYDSYQSVENQSWKLNTKKTFSFYVKDTINKNNLFVNIRNNNNYPYSNLFLITQLTFPNGEKIVDTLEYEMTDNLGNFLGTGFSELKENKLFYKENVKFPTSGEYKVSIAQAMRKNGEVFGIESLEGITDVGFRIEKN
jgi:gliding motility-associated lipoprotein GldH